MKREDEAARRWLDDPRILVVLGVVIPLAGYTIWGLVELLACRP